MPVGLGIARPHGCPTLRVGRERCPGRMRMGWELGYGHDAHVMAPRLGFQIDLSTDLEAPHLHRTPALAREFAEFESMIFSEVSQMSLYTLLKGKGPSGFGYGSTAEDVTGGLDLAGKTILLTGCNSGLGLEAMRVLALRGAQVIGAARTEAKANAACASIGGKTTGIACELADPASVRACVATLKAKGTPLDVILCNAGIMALPKLQQAYG